jgi:hypothetical protein
MTAESQKEVIREWLKKIKNCKSPGSTAFHETLSKHNPKNIEEFLDKFYQMATHTEFMRKEVARYGGGEVSSRGHYYRDSGSYRDRHVDRSYNRSRDRSRERERSRDRKDGGDYIPEKRTRYEEHTESGGVETVAAFGGGNKRPTSHYSPASCHGCGKIGHEFQNCNYITSNHPDANRDPTKSFHESTAGKRWNQITGRTQLTTAFTTQTFQRNGPNRKPQSNVQVPREVRNTRSPSPAPNAAVMSALQNKRSETPDTSRGRRGGYYTSRSMSASRSRSRDKERRERRHGSKYIPAHPEYTNTISDMRNCNTYTTCCPTDTVCTVANNIQHALLEYNVHENDILLPAIINPEHSTQTLLTNALPDTGAASGDYVNEETAAWLDRHGGVRQKCSGQICSGIGDTMCTECMGQYVVEVTLANDLIKESLKFKVLVKVVKKTYPIILGRQNLKENQISLKCFKYFTGMTSVEALLEHVKVPTHLWRDLLYESR